jgi:iron transport multicopper oxidase
VTLPTLTDIPGWPYIIENKPANNDLSRYFVAGTLLQRSSMTQLGNSLVLPFGGHCDNFNYT